MPPLKMLAILVATLALPVPASSHEFWIDPTAFLVPKDGRVVADFRVGETFKGGAQTYLPQRTRSLDFALGETVAPVDARIGDRPAVAMNVSEEGLLVVAHATTDMTVTYRDFAKFEAFVDHKDAMWVVEDHLALSLPDSDFKELYSRYAKTLVAVGSGQGEDRAFGLLTEIVALENPYTGDMTDGIDVSVFYEQKPRSDAQIEVFERAPDDSVKVSTVRTDERGRATVPVRPGHVYMLDSVVLRRAIRSGIGRKGCGLGKPLGQPDLLCS